MVTPSSAVLDSRTGRAPAGSRVPRVRTIVLLLVLAWSAAGARRSIANERRLGDSTPDPYRAHVTVGVALPAGDAPARSVIALRQLSEAAGDRHEATRQALVILPAADSTAVTFVLFQLAHLWYPQPVVVRADTGVAPRADAAAAFVYAHDRTRIAVEPIAPSEPVARAGSFTARRIVR